MAPQCPPDDFCTPETEDRALKLVDLRHGVVADADFPRQPFRL
jgi:hypothetical protein